MWLRQDRICEYYTDGLFLCPLYDFTALAISHAARYFIRSRELWRLSHYLVEQKCGLIQEGSDAPESDTKDAHILA